VLTPIRLTLTILTLTPIIMRNLTILFPVTPTGPVTRRNLGRQVTGPATGSPPSVQSARHLRPITSGLSSRQDRGNGDEDKIAAALITAGLVTGLAWIDRPEDPRYPERTVVLAPVI
jgi:hypothetical protein